MIRDYNVLFSIISKCIGLIKERHGQDINIDTISTDDDVVYKLVRTDLGSDVFGLEYAKYAILKYLISPTEYRHLEAMHAISHDWMHEKYLAFVKNKDNPEKIEYHSDVEESVLAETYGVLLYVEQLVALIHNYSGIPEDVSVRIAKYIRKEMGPELSIWKSVFVVGTQQKGYTETFAEYIWARLTKEGMQTFHKSTAENEAMATYVCFWLKTYYPNEYKDALVPNVNNDESWSVM